ncbi:MAG: polysaccharide biosynthesis/export family protein, partial [Calditrichaeota bacterium]|nr:polysaccharide biosynthesis/export family protein [Calditrichota bacterium]
MKSKSNRIPRVQAAALSLLIGLFFGTVVFAQEAETRENATPNAKILEAAKSLPIAGTGAIAYEGEVDRDQYLVGPGDRLALQIWSPAYQEVPVYVTGDGRVAVPFAGPVHVAGHTLTEAEQMVSAELDRAVKRARVSVSLLEPRLFRVHVTGGVWIPGTYAVRATTRLTEALTHAGGVRTKLEIQSGDTVNVPAANL